MKSTLLPTVCIVLVAAGLGVGFNAARPKDSLRISRNYFHKLAPPAPTVTGDNPREVAPAPDDAETRATEQTQEKPFPEVTLDEAAEIFMSPEFGAGEVVFVDARNDDEFAEGHIPRAIHIDRYNSDRYYKKAEPALRYADRIIVYCGGGECEDSIFLATELVMERMIPQQKLSVFYGGMEEWLGDNLTIEKGLGE